MYALHAVLIDKTIPLEEATKIAQEIINNKNRKYYRETTNQYRFRNISKQKFIKKSFRSKRINDQIVLVFGNLKE
jgi:penicillin V acylase-like amidase (Ntn superfamily)